MIYLCTFLFVVIFCKFLIKILNIINIIDHPNERSNHSISVPRGGGIAIIIAIILAYLYSDIQNNEINIMLISAMVLGVINFFDDRFNISILWRFISETIACIIVVKSLDCDTFIFKNYLPPLLEKTLMVIALLWFVNNFNFMDGIDGLASCESIHICLSIVMVLAFTTLSPHLSQLCLIIASANAGFLVWNWHRAKIFMGDVGSITMGFILGWLLLKLALSGMIFASIIIPLYYVADGLITLFRRLINKEKIWQAHSKHFYQRALKSHQGHDQVVRKIIIANVCLAFAAVLSINYQFIATIIAFVVIAILCYFLKPAPFSS
jgi:UDP-N-acetylmuramyl pentapeptide phosphotransferase/UDP-N-acetylglucosamine-1-phosphate transferase